MKNIQLLPMMRTQQASAFLQKLAASLLIIITESIRRLLWQLNSNVARKTSSVLAAGQCTHLLTTHQMIAVLAMHLHQMSNHQRLPHLTSLHRTSPHQIKRHQMRSHQAKSHLAR